MNRYTVIVVDGNACEIDDLCTNLICYRDLKEEEAAVLVKLSMERGFDVVLRVDGVEEEPRAET